jgi:hypothetical protein
MRVTQGQIEKVLTGDFNFTQLGFSMMITRLKRNYAKNPSKELLEKSTKDVNDFFDKFPRVMKEDYAIIARL